MWFVLFAAALGAPIGEMAAKATFGPLPDAAACYGLGALAINDLNTKFPKRDFRGACLAGDNAPDLTAIDPVVSLDLQQLAARATQFLPVSPRPLNP